MWLALHYCVAGIGGVGLTLIGLGIAELVTVTKLGGESLKTEITTFVTTFKDEIMAISALLLVLGLILLFTPLWGVGLALIGLVEVAI